MPTSRIDSASDASSSSSKCSRGWYGFGRMAATGISSSPPTPSGIPAGISAPSPLPRPPRRATAHLLRQLPVRHGAPRSRVEHNDRLPERRRLGETHGARNHRLVHPAPEVLSHLLLHLVRELGPRVVHREHDPPDVELRV